MSTKHKTLKRVLWKTQETFLYVCVIEEGHFGYLESQQIRTFFVWYEILSVLQYTLCLKNVYTFKLSVTLSNLNW